MKWEILNIQQIEEILNKAKEISLKNYGKIEKASTIKLIFEESELAKDLINLRDFY